MKHLFVAALVALVTVWPASAEEDAAGLARDAAVALGEAASALSAAERASDRIGALTDTIRAYEAGLAAMREGLRRAALRERALSDSLMAQDEELGELLVLLQKVSRAGNLETFAYPGTAADTVRAGILASAMVPALKEQTGNLRRDLDDLAALRAVQEAGVATLEEGLSKIREARTELSRAVSERTDLPPLIATDEAAMQALINSSETLSAFADSLVGENSEPAAADANWKMPVRGKVIRAFDEADAAGIRRPGWLVATEAEALVTAPARASVRFSGEVPGSGPVAILETSPGQLVILAGLGKSFVRRRQIVSAGEPVGLMGKSSEVVQENLIETSLHGGQPGSETLYIEIRQGQAPVDPSAFLRPPQEK